MLLSFGNERRVGSRAYVNGWRKDSLHVKLRAPRWLSRQQSTRALVLYCFERRITFRLTYNALCLKDDAQICAFLWVICRAMNGQVCPLAPVKCLLRADGCSWRGTRRQRRRHLQHCPAWQVKCPVCCQAVHARGTKKTAACSCEKIYRTLFFFFFYATRV